MDTTYVRIENENHKTIIRKSETFKTKPSYSGIPLKRTPSVQKNCPLYRDARFIEILPKI